MATISVLLGNCSGECYPLGHRTNVVGRAESLPIQVLDDLVSRKHLQILFDPRANRYSVIDMASKNGVFVNGVKIKTETHLADGDQVRIGNTVLLFHEEDADVNEAVWHRFKKAGEGQRPTRLDLEVRRSLFGDAGMVAVGRDSNGMLMAL